MEAKDWKGLPEGAEIVGGVLRDKQPDPERGDYDGELERDNPSNPAFVGPLSRITPGPWALLSRGTGRLVDVIQESDPSNGLAKVWLNDYRQRGVTSERRANARAIAEVPAMLALLREFVTDYERGNDGPMAWPDLHISYNKARALLARVEGR